MTISKLAIQPFGGAPGYTATSFPVIRQIPLMRAAFTIAASDDGDNSGKRKRNIHPLVYATPLEGVIEHGEEGVKIRSSGFQNPNERVRGVFTEKTTNNRFRDLGFEVKPSRTSNANGPDSYLLKIALPGSSARDWRKIKDDAIQIVIGRHEAMFAQDRVEEIVALSIMIDLEKVDEDPGFADFEERKKAGRPFVATFQLPPYIDAQSMLEGAVEYPANLKPLDRAKGALNIVLPVSADDQPRALKLPGLGHGSNK